MVEGEQDDPVFLRQVMENYKLKVSEWGRAGEGSGGMRKRERTNGGVDKVKKRDE